MGEMPVFWSVKFGGVNMERITKRFPSGIPNYSEGHLLDVIKRLADIEDILGDDYDLDRLREIVQADRDGRCCGRGNEHEQY